MRDVLGLGPSAVHRDRASPRGPGIRQAPPPIDPHRPRFVGSVILKACLSFALGAGLGLGNETSRAGWGLAFGAERGSVLAVVRVRLGARGPQVRRGDGVGQGGGGRGDKRVDGGRV